jgi:Ca2+-binding RTX toxin-like protein
MTIFSGTRKDDTIVGASTSDYLHGKAGDDRLNGRDGNDALDGGDGADTLTGGDGADEFYFRGHQVGDGDLIADFRDGIDTVRCTDFEAGTTVSIRDNADGSSSVFFVLEDGTRVHGFDDLSGTIDRGDIAFPY